MQSIADRLFESIKKMQMSQTKFAKIADISTGNLSDWKTKPNKKPSADALTRICEKHNININWLLTGKGFMFIEEQALFSEDCCQVLPVETEIAAGPAVEASTKPLFYMSIGTSVIKNVNEVYCFKVNGQSMEPEIMDRDLVIIKRTNNWIGTEGKICAVKVDNDLTLKRVIHDPNNKVIILAASNKDYFPMVIDPDISSVELVGVLYTLIRKVEM